MLDFCATPRHANCWGSAVTPLHAKGQLHAPAAVIPAYPLNGRLGEQCRSTGSTMVARVNTRPRPRHTQITLSYKIVEYCISTALGTDVYSCSAHRSAAVQVLGWVHTCNYSPGVDSASNRNEYQEYFLWVMAAVRRADNLTTFMYRLSLNLGVSTFWNPQGKSRHVMGLLYLYHFYIFHLHLHFHRRISINTAKKG